MNEKTQEKGIGSRMKFHILLECIFLIFWFWPGGLLWNRIEPFIGPFPFSIFMWLIVLPIINIVHMWYYFTWRWAKDKTEINFDAL